MLPALRGIFFLVDVLQTLSGLFSVVDVLPGSPLSSHLPFVAFFLSGRLSLSLVVFLLSRSVQSVPSCRSAYCDASLVANPFLVALVVAVDRSVIQSACRCLLAYWYQFSCGGRSIVQSARRRLLDYLIAVVVVPVSTGLVPLVHSCTSRQASCHSWGRSTDS
jgi:hypothetical protein